MVKKHIDAEKLKAEIEKNTPDRLELLVYRDIILALIESLQQEHQEEPEEESDLQDAEVIFSGHALHTDVTKWTDGHKLKIRIYDDN